MNRSGMTLVVSAAALLALGMASCSATSTTTGARNPSSASSGASSAPVASPVPSNSATSPGSVPVPAAPADPVAAAAWEALMSPVGEYAASASYQGVIDRFGPVEPYLSVQAAEERHIDALTRQLQRLGVTVPANPYAGKIAAPTDLRAAASAWAAGEVNNVAMYDRLLTKTSGDAALTRVFGNLRRASQEMHLPAFRAAAAHGGQLTPDQMRELGMG